MENSTIDNENNQHFKYKQREIKELNRKRRRLLTLATTIVGLAGIAAASVPFIISWLPSEKAQSAGAPVKFNPVKLEPGQQIILSWQGKPVFVVKRTLEILQRLNTTQHRRQLRDPDSKVATQQPDYATNPLRSIRDEYFVVIGICTHLGCIPTFRPEVAPADLGSQWVGGYFCPCHGSRFDLAGRVFKNVPAPTNLVVPPYYFMANNIIEIGINPKDT